MTQCFEIYRERGAGPFVTLRYLRTHDGPSIWLARNHRKGFGPATARRPFWQWSAFNVVMAAGFAVGAALFAIGAILSLFPALATEFSLAERGVNTVYFIGSVIFTFAAYLQILQSANAGVNPLPADAPRFRSVLGWRPKDPGWVSSATQFAGTLLFNANTYDAIQGGSWLRQDIGVWGPDILGSTLFLVSGYLALVETCHGWWAWRPRTLAWWVVIVNFLGSVAFMISAVLSFVPPSGLPAGVTDASILFTFIGAVGFFIGALLSIRESVSHRDIN